VEWHNRQRGCRAAQVDVALLQRFDQRGRQRIYVDFQTHGEGGRGTHAIADTTKFGAFDGLAQAQGVAPIRFVTEGVESENVPAVFEHGLGIFPDCSFEPR
jgi:hypothetical protein